jgi:hypothetical protein
MLGARAMALVRLGRLDEAADRAVKAAARPNAHPRYSVADFLAAFQFDPQGAALFRKGARRLGTP